jgi:hypothetical protein
MLGACIPCMFCTNVQNVKNSSVQQFYRALLLLCCSSLQCSRAWNSLHGISELYNVQMFGLDAGQGEIHNAEMVGRPCISAAMYNKCTTSAQPPLK